MGGACSTHGQIIIAKNFFVEKSQEDLGVDRKIIFK
jgi:hypothetical protein